MNEKYSKAMFGAFLFALTIAILLSEVLATSPQPAPLQGALPTTTTTSSSIFTSTTTTYTTWSSTLTSTSTNVIFSLSTTVTTTTFSSTATGGAIVQTLTLAASGILTVTSTNLVSSVLTTITTQLVQMFQTSTSLSLRTITRSAVLQSPGVPGFFLESILIGLVLGLLTLYVIRRARHFRSRAR